MKLMGRVRDMGGVDGSGRVSTVKKAGQSKL